MATIDTTLILSNMCPKREFVFFKALNCLNFFSFFFFNPPSNGYVKIKLKLPHFHVSDTCVSIYPGAPLQQQRALLLEVLRLQVRVFRDLRRMGKNTA